MTEFCYTTVPGKVKTLLSKIREVGVPPKVTVQWLKTIGFTSSNDSSLIGVLKQIDFVDQGRVPTARWSQYRGANHKAVLGEAIRHGYEDLFEIYSDADQRSQTELSHVISQGSTGGKQVIVKTVSTFKSLTELADFATPIDSRDDQSVEGTTAMPEARPAPSGGGQTSRPSVHIDIQIHISPEATLEQIDKVFESMARHIYREATAEQ